MPLTTVEEVARRVLAEIGDFEQYILAVEWVNDRWQQLVRKARFRQLRRVGSLTLPARVTAGTIAVTRGSSTVTGDATAAAAWAAILPTDLKGSYFRTRVAWYPIEQINSTEMTLGSDFGEDTVAAGGTYSIVKREHALPAEVRWLGAFGHQRLRKPLWSVHADFLDVRYPDRPHVGGVPYYVAEQGSDDESGVRVVEVYPPAVDIEVLRYVYWKDVVKLQPNSYLPNFVDSDILKEGALVNAYRFKAAQSVSAGQLEQAAYWGNFAERQETRWLTKVIPDAIRADRGIDDLSLIFESRYDPGGPQDVRTARDDVLLRWTPLS